MPNSPDITLRPNSNYNTNVITLSPIELAFIHKNINYEDIKEFIGGILHDIIDVTPKKDMLFNDSTSAYTHDKLNLQEFENTDGIRKLFTYYLDETNPINNVEECCGQARLAVRFLCRMADKDNHFEEIGQAMRMLSIYLTKAQRVERVIDGVKYWTTPSSNYRIDFKVDRQPYNKTNYVYSDMTIVMYINWDKV